MDLEAKFFSCVALGLLAAVSGAVTSYTLNNANNNAAIQAMVDKGASPVEAGCAIRPDEQRMSCALAVLGAKKEVK